MRTWRDVHHEEIERQRAMLVAARARGQTWLKINDRIRDPSRLSDRKIDDLARREAERLTNYAINVERRKSA